MWCCVTGWVVPHISKNCTALLDSWQCGHHGLSNYSEPLNKGPSVTSQKIQMLIKFVLEDNTTNRTVQLTKSICADIIQELPMRQPWKVINWNVKMHWTPQEDRTKPRTSLAQKLERMSKEGEQGNSDIIEKMTLAWSKEKLPAVFHYLGTDACWVGENSQSKNPDSFFIDTAEL
jgi:hypothetical protein